jgi:hypothetical protein
MKVMALNAAHVAEVFQTAMEENQLSSLREQQVVNLPDEGEVWVSGDLHDHRRNFEKFFALADLGNNPQRHVILQELIHGDHWDANGAEGSWKMLYEAAEKKCDFPNQVHFLLANHDLAQVHGEGIMKAGLSVCEAFTAGVKRDFGLDATGVNLAIAEFVLSLPLAVRGPNGLFFCHSLPNDEQIPSFDYTVFDRPLTGADYRRRNGPVYQLIWGRGVTPVGVAQFAARVGASIIITGHQPQDTGYAINGDQHLIVASDHNQGIFIPLELDRPFEMRSVVRRIKRFAAIDLSKAREAEEEE